MSTTILPVELWLDIFRWATMSSTTWSLRATNYSPFEAGNLESVDKKAVAVKCTLVCVCKLWRELTRDLLFEDVTISRGAHVLQQALQTQGDEKHRWIRRACIPYYSCTPYNTNDLKTVATFLEACPALEVLARPSTIRPEVMTFDFPAADCPALLSLKRLDWWHYNEAARSGGVNALTEVLRAAPNLQYLSLGGDLWLNLMQRGPISLPALTTLRIRRMNLLFLQQVCHWSMPSLRNVIVDVFSAPRLLEPLWEHYGEQVKAIELGMHMKFYVLDLVCHVLTRCPALEELSYYLMFTAVPHTLQQPHATLTTLRWHAHVNPFLSVHETNFWDLLGDHISTFSSPFFPALKQIVLHGDWQDILGDERSRPLFRKLGDRKIMVERQR
jgi:hypothetical protein